MEAIDPCLFYWYAGTCLERWKQLLHQRLTHTAFGPGTVAHISRNRGDVRILVTFDEPHEGKRQRKFSGEVFRRQLSELTISTEIRALVEQAVQAKQEAERRERNWRIYLRLAEHYGVEPFRDKPRALRLYRILQNLEKNELVDDPEITWLQDTELYPVAAVAHEQAYECTGGGWHLVNASKTWRIASQPEKGVSATNQALAVVDSGAITDKVLISAIWTTRGGCFSDMGRLDEAEECGKRASGTNPASYQAARLLWSVYKQKGWSAKAAEWLKRAEELLAAAQE